MRQERTKQSRNWHYSSGIASLLYGQGLPRFTSIFVIKEFVIPARLRHEVISKFQMKKHTSESKSENVLDFVPALTHKCNIRQFGYAAGSISVKVFFCYFLINSK